MTTKNTLSLVIFFLILICVSFKTYAFRVSGAELNYTYNTTTGKYDFTLIAYSNCGSPVQFLNQYSIFYTSQSCNREGQFVVVKESESIIKTNCKSFLSQCNGGSSFGIKKLIYKGTFNDATLCSDWKFNWIECNRNSTINTIAQINTGVCLYVETTLNNLNSKNNSAKFATDPNVIVCNSIENKLNFKATDADGDSLVYSLINGKQNSLSSITYNAGLSGSNPLNSSIPITINKVGEITVKPSIEGQKSVIVVKVDEYKSGNLVASTMRDIQVNVEGCANNQPSLSGFNLTNNFVSDVCITKDEHCFTIETKEIDLADSEVYVNFIKKLPGQLEVIKPINGDKKKKEIYTCWLPSQNRLGKNSFLISISDSACPYTGNRTYEYIINVKPKLDFDSVTFNNTIKCDTQVTIGSLRANGGSPAYTYVWSTGQSTPLISTGIGSYKLTVNDANGCKKVQNFTIKGGILGEFKTNGACLGSAVQFEDISKPIGTNTLVSWDWDFGDGQKSTLKNPSHLYADTGIYLVKLKIKDNKNCITETSQKVKVCLPPNIFLSRGKDRCVGSKDWEILKVRKRKSDCDTIRKLILNFMGFQVVTIIPNLQDLRNGKNPYPNLDTYRFSFKYPFEGNYTITAHVFYNTCSVFLTDTFKLYSKPEIKILEPDYTFDCVPKTITAIDMIDKYKPWTYEWQKDYKIKATEPPYVVNSTGVYSLTAKNQAGCTDLKLIYVKSPFKFNFNPESYCENNANISMQNERISEWNIIEWNWNFQTGSPLTSTIQNPSHVFPKDSVWVVRLISRDSKNCIDTSYQSVVTHLPKGNLSLSDNLFCHAEPISVTGVTGKTISKFGWDLGFDNPFDYIIGTTSTDSLLIGNPANQRKPRFSFSRSNGYFVPKLPYQANKLITQTVYYNKTCQKKYTSNYTLYPPMKVDLKISNLCFNNEITTFTGIIIQSQFNIINWNYNLKSISSLYDQNIPSILPKSFSTKDFTLKFNKHEPFEINIKAEDDNALHVCKIDTTLKRTIKKISKPDFSKSISCAKQEILFDFTPQDSYETQDSLLFVWGDSTFTPNDGKFGSKNSDPFFKKTYQKMGNYTVKVIVKTSNTDGVFYGCKDSTVKTIDVLPNPKADFKYQPLCENQETLFENISQNATENQVINTSKNIWIVNNDTLYNKQNTLKFLPNTSKEVIVKLIVTDNLDCKNIATKVLTINPGPLADFDYTISDKNVIFINKSISQNSEANIIKNHWELGNGDTSNVRNSNYIYSKIDDYTVQLKVTNNFNCSQIFSKVIELKPKHIFPTAFSPNGDNINNEALIIHKGIKKLIKLQIFNRWGELVFDTTDLNQGWDGKFKGIDQPVGVYQYMYELEDVYSNKISKQGNLTLIR